MPTTPVRQREVDRHVSEQTGETIRQAVASVSETVIAEARLEQAIAAARAAGADDIADRLRTALVVATTARRELAARTTTDGVRTAT